ncbi:hypothetical protein PMZ80_004495 [Knufia obscura]|uniref:Uncharacterized protein n=1 Tax=Knufia obscura TaxID=1635080 RepID=A0ABR0RTB7_9EURO|nr:hypothetical protein PMZ80_004495 [Knufia obscura]
MESIQSKITAAAPRNRELLQTLAETDYAKPALEQQKRYIADVESEIKQLDKRIKELEEKRKKELKEHEKYRDSTMKRFAYKVSRKQEKFNVKAEKEEREYFEVLQEEHKANEMRKNLGQTLAEAQRNRSELEGTAARHDQAQRCLDELYDSIFEGPTPGFPEEDSRENSANDALNQYHNMRVRVESETQVLNNLGKALQKMNIAKYALAEARSHSQMDMFGGGMMSDMMERNALSKGEIAFTEARMLVEQASRMSPDVHRLPQVNVAQGNLMSDVFFDNIFTDMQFHEKIKQSQFELERADRDLQAQRGSATQRHSSLNLQLQQQAQGLESARVALQKVRENAFQRHAATQ